MNDPTAPPPPRNSIALLRQLAQPPAPPREHCDLCAAPLAEDHEHLIEPVTRQLKCACEPCAILFSNTEGGKFRRVPREIESWNDFEISDMQWEALGIPIALAFFFHSSPANQIVAMYPSPGGATEANLAGEVWDILCLDNPRLASMRPDVQALLVNRMNGKREYYLAPIDRCFGLVGLIRMHWRGLSGGARVWQEMDQFFKSLKSRSSEVG